MPVADLRLRKLWITIGYLMLAIVIQQSITPEPIQIDTGLEWQDKLLHIGAYFTLMIWFMQIYTSAKERLLYALLFVVVGIAMEVIQSFSPERYFETWDMLANTVGVLLALSFWKTACSRMLPRIERLFIN